MRLVSVKRRVHDKKIVFLVLPGEESDLICHNVGGTPPHPFAFKVRICAINAAVWATSRCLDSNRLVSLELRKYSVDCPRELHGAEVGEFRVHDTVFLSVTQPHDPILSNSCNAGLGAEDTDEFLRKDRKGCAAEKEGNPGIQPNFLCNPEMMGNIVLRARIWCVVDIP
jgi:hypothetical protein